MEKKKQPRVDKERNKAKVLWAVLKKPLADQRTIAKDAGVWKWTVCRHLQDLGQNGAKNKAIEEIIAVDAQIVAIAQWVILDRLQNPDKEKTRDIISAADTSAKRYSLFAWDATDNDWWLKAIQEINITIWN